MPLTLEEYIERLGERTDLPWPAAPKIEPAKAKPALERLPVKCVFWTVYGTLVAIPEGEILFEHSQDFVTDAALDKVIREFKMWNSMGRKPGAPSAYLKEQYRKALTVLKLAGSGGERYPEVQTERIWDDIVKKLQQKEYSFDGGTYGPVGEFVRKVAYFYHASIQGAGAYPGAADTLRMVAERCIAQGLLADGQSFTPGQLQRCLRRQDPGFDLAATIPLTLRVLSSDKKARKPSETLFRAALQAAQARGIQADEVLHVGSNLARDIAPAKRTGFLTALFAGDRASLVATREHLKNPATRPDVLITELPQILEVIG